MCYIASHVVTSYTYHALSTVLYVVVYNHACCISHAITHVLGMDLFDGHTYFQLITNYLGLLFKNCSHTYVAYIYTERTGVSKQHTNYYNSAILCAKFHCQKNNSTCYCTVLQWLCCLSHQCV